MELLENERIDDLERRGYRIIQNRKKFCFGQDAVLLSWFAEVKPGEKVMDLCSGSGVVPLLMDARNACGEYVGLEIQEDMAEMAGRSVRLNQAEDHIRMIHGDLREVSGNFPKGSFQVVTVNPPYMKSQTGLTNPDPARAMAKHEISCTLSDVLSAASYLLEERGRFYMVHRVSRLAEVMEALRAAKLALSRIQFVYPFRDKEANLMLIQATKGGHDIPKVDPPFIVFDAPDVYSKQARKVYWEEKEES